MSKTLSKKDSLDRFAYEFTKFPKILPENERKFLKWVSPLKKEFFKNKTVLEAGCGNGRAKKLVAFDNHPQTVKIAKKNLKVFKNAKVFLNTIYKIPFKNKFDIVMCIGVLQHLEKPKIAVENLIKTCKKGGTIVVWVYGHKGNKFILRFINPIRVITSKSPLFATYSIAFIFSIPLYSYLKLVKTKNEYLKLMSTYSFNLLFNIVFDQLLPKIANYWKKEEVLELFNQPNVKNVRIYSVAGNTWTVVANKI